jgi:hypothetical protein
MRTTVILAFLLLSGCCCFLSYEPDISSKKLAHNAKAYVAVPENGRYGRFVYPDSGETTTQVILTTFLKYLTHAIKGSRYEPYENALKTAKGMDCRYLIYPTILHWEERATEWSGKPDRISVKIEIINIQTGDLVDSVKIKGESKWATFGGDHPQDLLPEPIEKYVASLFR